MLNVYQHQLMSDMLYLLCCYVWASERYVNEWKLSTAGYSAAKKKLHHRLAVGGVITEICKQGQRRRREHTQPTYLLCLYLTPKLFQYFQRGWLRGGVLAHAANAVAESGRSGQRKKPTNLVV